MIKNIIINTIIFIIAGSIVELLPSNWWFHGGLMTGVLVVHCNYYNFLKKINEE